MKEEIYFKVENNKDKLGDNWLIADFGDKDGKNYWVTTNCIRGTELVNVSRGAKADAELVAKLLNEYWNKTINIKKI